MVNHNHNRIVSCVGIWETQVCIRVEIYPFHARELLATSECRLLLLQALQRFQGSGKRCHLTREPEDGSRRTPNSEWR
jgi:hypothetical protein